MKMMKQPRRVVTAAMLAALFAASAGAVYTDAGTTSARTVTPPPTSEGTSAAAGEAATLAHDPGSDVLVDSFAARAGIAVNLERYHAGLALLRDEPRLAAAAASYAKVLADNDWYSHEGPDGSTLVSRVEAAGFPFNVRIGEVIAWSATGWSPEDVVDAWMRSPAHREQILEPRYRRAGAGCYFKPAADGGMLRCVMDLAE